MYAAKTPLCSKYGRVWLESTYNNSFAHYTLTFNSYQAGPRGNTDTHRPSSTRRFKWREKVLTFSFRSAAKKSEAL